MDNLIPSQMSGCFKVRSSRRHVLGACKLSSSDSQSHLTHLASWDVVKCAIDYLHCLSELSDDAVTSSIDTRGHDNQKTPPTFTPIDGARRTLLDRSVVELEAFFTLLPVRRVSISWVCSRVPRHEWNSCDNYFRLSVSSVYRLRIEIVVTFRFR